MGYAPGPLSKKDSVPEFEIEVDGEAYVWWLHRRPQWSSDAAKWRGMAIAVRHQEGKREAARLALMQRTPLARLGTVEEVAEAVRWLIEDASYLTGQTLGLDGGRPLT